MDKLQSMNAFIQVSRAGSFSAAATQLGLSKSQVSKQVSYLEKELGVQLLNRTTRRLGLTEAGRAYRDRALDLLHDLEETEEAVAQLNTEPRGTLRVMAPTSFGSFHLARAIADYRRLYAGVALDLVLTEGTPDLVEMGVDIAIRIGELDDSSFVARKLSQVRMVVCAAPEYLARRGRPASPQDLENHNCLIYTISQHRNEWMFAGPADDQPVAVSGDIRSNVGDALRIAALRGCGLAQLPNYMVALDLRAGRLQAVLEDFEPRARPVYAIYQHRRYLSAKVRTFVEFLQEQYQLEPYWERWAGA